MLLYLSIKEERDEFTLTPTLPINPELNQPIKFYPTVKEGVLGLTQTLTQEDREKSLLEVRVYLPKNKPSVLDNDSIISQYSDTLAKETKEVWLTSEVELKYTTTVYLNLNQPKELDSGLTTYDFLEEKPQLEDRRLHWLAYYIEALNQQMYTKRKWITGIISVKETYKEVKDPYVINRDDTEGVYYCYDSNGAKLILDGVPIDKPPVPTYRKITLNKDSGVPNVKEEVVTTTGELLNNYCAIVYQFNDLIDYIPGKWSAKTTHGIFKKLKAMGELTSDKIIKAQTMIEHLDTYNDYVVPAASWATFTTHKDLKKRKKELFEENKDKLHDQTVLAKMSEELIALDKESISGDESEPFFIKDKMFNVVRKKMLIMQGTEKDLNGEETPLITTSLDEGWQIKDLPNQVNGLRAGAYMRGNLTALGGVDVKTMQRNLALYAIKEKDCKSKRGLYLQVTRFNKDLWDGRYIVGEDIPLTEERINSLLGKWITLRDVGFCKTEPYGVCEKCMGDKVKNKPKAIALEVSNIGSASQGAMMSATHGKALKVTKVTLAEISS